MIYRSLLIMKLVIFLSIAFTFNTIAESKAQKITLNVKNTTLREVMKEIQRQQGYSFFFRGDDIAATRINAIVKQADLRHVMDQILADRDLVWSIEEETIVIAHKSPTKPQRESTQQNLEISGKVTDQSGTALAGVTVAARGTTAATTTDAGGNYRITVPDQASTLVFTILGYETVERTLTNQRVVNVTMEATVSDLDEVVVVGYTTQKKASITGAVAVVAVDELKQVPANNFAQQLQGRVAGVTVGNDGTPGGNVMVRIRGVGSITGGNDPLYIIDGVPTQGGLNQINPNDIESMQILKDASSASIYGARASNGVVIITTKKGKEGRSRLTVESFYGVQRPSSGPEMLSPQQFADLTWENYRNIGNVDPTTGNPADATFGSGPNPVIPDYLLLQGGAMEGDPRVALENYTNDPTAPGFGTTKFMFAKTNKAGTDWWDVVTQLGHIQSHNLSVSGGSNKNTYAITGGYYDQEGIFKHTNFKRYSVRANTTFNIMDVLTIGENLQFAYTDNVSTIIRAENSPALAYQMAPFMPVYDVGGNFAGGRAWADHPYTRQYRNKDNHAYNARLFGNAFAEAKLGYGLTLKTSLGIDYANFNFSNFSPAAPESFLLPQQAQLSVTNSYTTNVVWTNTVGYQKTFGNRHRLDVLAGTEAVKSRFRNTITEKADFAFEDINYRYLNAGTTLLNATGGGSDSRLFSYFGKADYNLDEKYLVSATIRRDASSRFSTANRWGTFPAFSVGWRLSEEPFLERVTFIDELKLRGGWGQTGNQEIDSYNQFTTYATNLHTSSYSIDGQNNALVPGFYIGAQGNPDARWEAQTMTNLGVDLSVFNGKFAVTVDAYNRKSSDLLLVIPSPATDGQNRRPAVNIGGIQNKGLDIALNYRNRSQNSNWRYDVGLNWSVYRNRVTELYGGSETFIPGFSTRQAPFTRTAVGQPISAFYGYTIDGIFQTQEEADAHATQGGDRALYNQPGRFKFRDIDQNGVIDANDESFIGNPHPDFTYGLNLSVSYKSFDLSVFIQGVQGNDIYNYQKWWTDFQNLTGNRSVRMLDSWSPENPNATLPKTNSIATGFESQASTYFIEDGSYLRGKNVMIGYTFPSRWTSRLNMQQLRVYVQATNFFTLTNYNGLDPEVNLSQYGAGADRDIGVDRGIYPLAQSFNLGLTVGF